MKIIPFHLNDIEDFPIAHYITEQTNKWINQYEYVSGHSYKQETMIKWLNEWDFIKIHSADYIFPKSSSKSNTFSKIVTNSGGDKAIIVLKFPKFYDSKEDENNDEEWSETGILIYSNISESGYKLFRDSFFKNLTIKPIRENNISLIVQSRSGYDTQTFDLPKQKLNLEYNYGTNFLPIHNKILSTLNKKKSNGLVLLHGAPGTGKTHYLKYLASKIKDKKVMFVPPYLVDFITSPEMTPFLIENSNSILFIEDAERVITDRDTNGANGVSNILNLTDGILGDILNIQIVATFNMDRKKIDTALLRKGRLIAEHRFDKLNLEDTNKLIKHLEIDHISTEALTLTDIYNLKEVEYKAPKPLKIGF